MAASVRHFSGCAKADSDPHTAGNSMRTVLSVAAVLLAIASSARAQQDTAPAPDAVPEAVVQRFVDAANDRNANAMAALVAPDAVFARFPGGQVIARNRDGIREHYSRQLQSLPLEFRITIQPRIVEGQVVIDQEHFAGMPGETKPRGCISCVTA